MGTQNAVDEFGNTAKDSAKELGKAGKNVVDETVNAVKQSVKQSYNNASEDEKTASKIAVFMVVLSFVAELSGAIGLNTIALITGVGAILSLVLISYLLAKSI